VRWTSATGLLLGVALVASGCGDPSGFTYEPLLVTDTVDVAAPLPQNAALPTAIDVTGDGLGGVRGGRFPERARDALEWDFLVRLQGNQVVLLPPRAIGVDSRAAITTALVGETFDGLREVPGQRAFVLDSAVVMNVGSVYAVRSRETVGLFGVGCIQFAKLQPLRVDPAAGLLRVQVVTNERCGDPRLVRE
jgi:hypothetical protein